MKKLLVLSVALLPAACVFAADWYVKADAEAGGNGSASSPFKTIQEAVEAASPEDTVKVLPGVYDQGSTTAWTVRYSSDDPFEQQTRVYVTKKLTIVSTGGREVTTIKGSYGSRTSPSSPGYFYYRVDGVQGMVIGAEATGTVIRGFTFDQGYAHQSAAPGSVAAGGLCAATPSSENSFLVTDCAFVRCYGRGGGGLHGGTAIRCLFKNCKTNYRGSSAYEARLYNCLSYDSLYDADSYSTWDFCDCIAINCTTFNSYARGGFCRSSASGFGGTHYNSLSFGNNYSSNWDQMPESRGTSVNSLSDDRYEPTTAGALEGKDAAYLSQLYLSAWTHDFRTVKDGLLDGNGDRANLTAAGDDFVIPADEINKDFNGNDIASTDSIPIGIIMPSAEPKTGVLALTSQVAVNGVDIAHPPAAVRCDTYPAEVRISQSTRMKTVNAQKPLMALSFSTIVRYFGLYDDIVQLMPKPGAQVDWGAWDARAEFYVGGEGASDSNPGTADKPFATIQKAVDMVTSRTIVYVRPGHYGVQNYTYAPEPGAMDTDSIDSGLRASINIPRGKNVVIKSTDGPAVTFIEGAPDPETKGCGPNATRCAAISNAANGVFCGFTFCNGYAYNNDTVTDEERSYSGAVGCGGVDYQQIYDSVFTGNHGRGIVRKGLYARCVFSNNTDIASCVVYNAILTSCVFADNGKSNTGYILYNNVYAYSCSLSESVCGTGCNLQNVNGKIVNCAYDTKSGRMLDFAAQYNPYPVIGSVVKARDQVTQTYPDAMTYADPYFHAPGTADLRLQRPSVAEGYGVLADEVRGKIPDTDFTQYLHGDFLNRPLVNADGSVNAGAYSEALDAGMSDAYVDAEHGNDNNDGRSEATAKKTLQAVMEVRIPQNAKVVALPGHYNEGSALHVGNSFKSSSKTRPAPTVRSRVVVPEGYTLVSRDGAATTFIEGEPDPNSEDPYHFGRGPKAMRCVFLEKNATLRGFTLTNGHTDYYEKGIDDDSYVDDFYGAGVFGRATSANGNGRLAGTRVEGCIIVSNYADLGGAGGITAFYNCFVTNNWGVNYGGFFRHGACYNCYVDDCHGSRVCDVLYDCINCTFGSRNGGVGAGSTTPPFENVDAAARVWNFLMLSTPNTGKSGEYPFGRYVKNIVIPSGDYPRYDAEPENVYNELSLADLRALYEDGRAKVRTAPTVDAGTASALELLQGMKDVDGTARIKNTLLDIGAYEYDWMADYGKALGRKVTVTDEDGVFENDGVVQLGVGASLCADWPGPAHHVISATLNGPGELTVLLNGERLDPSATVGDRLTYDFTSHGSGVNKLEFSYAGDAGFATIDSLVRKTGSTFFVR